MTPLILLPGMLCDHRMWLPQLWALTDLAHMTVADLTRDETVSAMAATVLATAPPAFALAGLSMGGMVAMEILRQAPDRVRRLALLDTDHLPDPPERTARRWAQIAQAEAGNLATLVGELAHRYLAPGHSDGAALTTTVCTMALDAGPAVYARQSLALIGRRDQTDTLSALRCPTLVMCGADDKIFPVDRHRAVAALIRLATLRVIPAAGHLPTIEQPELTNSALRLWLEEDDQA